MLDLEKQSQDIKAVSKEFYVWGETEDSDVKDVTDRLAYLTYVQGSLAATLASSIDASRAPLKALRDSEAHMQPKRNIRLNYELQISRLRNEGKPGTEAKIRELEQLLKKAEAQDEDLEKEIDLLKRKAIVDSETQKWEAIREVCLFIQPSTIYVGGLHVSWSMEKSSCCYLRRVNPCWKLCRVSHRRPTIRTSGLQPLLLHGLHYRRHWIITNGAISFYLCPAAATRKRGLLERPMPLNLVALAASLTIQANLLELPPQRCHKWVHAIPHRQLLVSLVTHSGVLRLVRLP